MDRALLRPVPARPPGSVPDPDAARHVAAFLSALDERDGLALALVALAGHPRAEVGRRLALGEEELARALARARRELRRSVTPLPGSGWCSLAERLVSDRLDESLATREETRLAVHLRNCPRCVEHERRLVQATDALTASLPAAAPPALAVAQARVDLEVVEPEPPGPERAGELDSVAAWYVMIVGSLLLAMAGLVLVIAGAFDSGL
jgi:hypothetical protein